MNNDTYYIIDFDSTFVRIEALEKLAEIALSGNPEKEKLISKIKDITDQGMNGKISFDVSLEKRLKLFKAKKEHIAKLINILKKNISYSMSRNKVFFKKYKKNIYIISGGFIEYIYPLLKPYGIDDKHILANKFIFNKKGEIVGYDKKNPLSQKDGKTKQIKELNLKGKIYVIGDGYSDYQIKKAGLANKFFVFCENLKRDSVVKRADQVLPNLDEFLYLFDLPRSYSYPKNRIKILLLENIHESAVKLFNSEGYQIQAVSKALNEEELIKALENISILGIRSKTKITEKVLKAAKRLLSVGTFCIGTNQVDLQAASQNGVAVFNAPYSNTRSVVELALSEIISLNRKIFDKSMKLHQGIWEKSAKNCYEIRGKKLGIIGYGNIGSQLSVLAENLGMETYYYDINEKLALGNAIKCSSLSELLKKVDIVTVHVDGRKENKNFIDEKEFKLMKDGVIFLNLSRGFVVNIEALAENIKSGKVAGAAVDVFPNEPASNKEKFFSRLQNLSNVILTPHIAGSTEEAQENIGKFVSQKIIDFINHGNTQLSVNFPNLHLPPIKNIHRVIHIHKNVPGVLANINTLFGENDINIEGQYLKTNEEIGYVITDINKNYNKKIINKLKSIPGTIKIRILY